MKLILAGLTHGRKGAVISSQDVLLRHVLLACTKPLIAIHKEKSNKMQQCTKFYYSIFIWSRSQWPSGLRCRSAAARLLRSWVQIPPGAWIFVCYECRVLSGRGLCDKLITHPEESYRLWCVVVCDLETSRIGAPCIYIYIYMRLVT